MSASRAVPFRTASAHIRSSSPRKAICCASVETPRSKLSSAIATFQPSPGVPRMQSAPVRAPSKNSSLNSVSPVIWRIGRIETPGCLTGTSRKDRPSRPRLPSVVRHRTKTQSANCASEVQVFWPSITHVIARRALLEPCTGADVRRDRIPHSARNSPGTSTPRLRRSAAGSASSAPRCRRRGSSGPIELDAQVTEPRGRAGTRVLLREDHLLGERRRASTVFARPARHAPARTPERLLPGASLLGPRGQAGYAAQTCKRARERGSTASRRLRCGSALPRA